MAYDTPTREQLVQDYAQALAIINSLRAQRDQLLAAGRRMLDCHQAAMDAAQSSASQFVERRCDCGACDEARAAIANAAAVA
jgi:hypothetical protein